MFSSLVIVMRGVDFAQKLTATVAFNQSKFIGREEFWFRPMCNELGFTMSNSFFDTFLVNMFVVCVDPMLLNSTTADITGTWGDNKNKFKIKKKWIKAVKKADLENKIRYGNTFKLLKFILPSVLPYFSKL